MLQGFSGHMELWSPLGCAGLHGWSSAGMSSPPSSLTLSSFLANDIFLGENSLQQFHLLSMLLLFLFSDRYIASALLDLRSIFEMLLNGQTKNMHPLLTPILVTFSVTNTFALSQFTLEQTFDATNFFNEFNFIGVSRSKPIQTLSISAFVRTVLI